MLSRFSSEPWPHDITWYVHIDDPESIDMKVWNRFAELLLNCNSLEYPTDLTDEQFNTFWVTTGKEMSSDSVEGILDELLTQAYAETEVTLQNTMKDTLRSITRITRTKTYQIAWTLFLALATVFHAVIHTNNGNLMSFTNMLLFGTLFLRQISELLKFLWERKN